MSYVPHFENDIFISYAHVDNLAAEGEPKWVEQFHKQLEIALTKRIGRIGLLKIWRDKRLEGDNVFDETIQKNIDDSALFLALTSNGYLASDYCKDELQAFYKKAQTEQYGLQIGDRSRIYNALLTNISHKEWPEEYGRISGHPFHDAEDEDTLGVPSALADKKFHKQLRALVDSLYKMLLAFKESSKDSTTVEDENRSATSGSNKQSVFLADITDSLRPLRTRIINELERKEIKVISKIPPPYEVSEHEESVKTALGETVLSVHLFDGFSGREVDGDPDTTYPKKQVEIAKENIGTQLIWVPNNLELKSIEDEAHKSFLTQLEKGDRDKGSYEFMRSATTSLVPQILKKLEQLQTVTKTNGTSQSVLLDTHLKDQIFAFELGSILLKNGIQAYINPQEDDPNKNMDILEARLKEVSTLMILFGSVNEDWVRQRLGAALQLSVIKNLQIKSFCVFTVPPEKKKEELNFNFGPVNVHTFNNSKNETLDPEALTTMLETVKKEGVA